MKVLRLAALVFISLAWCSAASAEVQRTCDQELLSQEVAGDEDEVQLTLPNQASLPLRPALTLQSAASTKCNQFRTDQLASLQKSGGPIKLSGSFGLVSDYRYRGVSLSDRRPVPQASLSATYGAVTASIWTSKTAKSAGGSRQEIDLSLAATASVAGFEVTGTGLAYLYPGDSKARYVELALTASRAAGPFTATTSLSWAPPQSSIGGKDNLYVSLGSSWDSKLMKLSTSVGREQGAFAARGKWDWSVTASRAIGPLDISVSYIDSDAHVVSPRNRIVAGGTVILGTSLKF